MHHLSFASGLTHLNTHHQNQKTLSLWSKRLFHDDLRSLHWLHAQQHSACVALLVIYPENVFSGSRFLLAFPPFLVFLPFPQFPPALVLCYHLLLHWSLLCLSRQRKSSFNMWDCLNPGGREVPVHNLCLCVCVCDKTRHMKGVTQRQYKMTHHEDTLNQ